MVEGNVVIVERGVLSLAGFSSITLCERVSEVVGTMRGINADGMLFHKLGVLIVLIESGLQIHVLVGMILVKSLVSDRKHNLVSGNLCYPKVKDGPVFACIEDVFQGINGLKTTFLAEL